MSGRTELLVYLTTSIGTVVVLFVLQQWYGSYLDVSYHEGFAERPASAELAALRAEEAQKRSGLEAAKQALGERGRGANAKIAPKPSSDLSAMNGWIRRPGFGAYTPRAPEPATSAVVPSVPAPVEGVPVEGGVAPAPVQGVVPVAGEEAVPAEAAVAPTARAPKPVAGVTVEASGQVPLARPTRRQTRAGVAPKAAVPLKKVAPRAQE